MIEDDQVKFDKTIFQRMDTLKIYDYRKVFKFDKSNLSQLSALPIMRNILL